MITYEIQNNESVIDVMAELSVRQGQPKKQRRTAQIIYVLIAVFALIMAALIKASAGVKIYLVVFAVVFLVLAAKFDRLQKHSVKKSLMKRGDDFLGAHGTWTFSEEGIYTDSTMSKGITYWSTVESYGYFDKYLYIRRKDGAFYLIEKGRLGDEEMAELMGLLEQNGIKAE